MTRIRRSPASCIAIPTGCCSSWCMSARSIAGSVSAAKWSGRARRPRSPRPPIAARSTTSARISEIWEVILTGGDPLMLSPRRLAEIMADLAAIDHVKIIRIHTRVPVADPARISAEMVAALRVEGATTWVALHANHPRELTDKARAACAGLVDAGIPLVSQSVLLRGVNDDARDAGSADAGLRRMPDQALLPAPRRSRARHRASAHHARAGPGTDAAACAAACPACASRNMCSIFPAATARRRSARAICRRRIRSEGESAGRNALSCRRLLRRRSSLSAEAVIGR